MLQTLDKMIEAQSAPASVPTWTAIPAFLDAEVAAGGSKSSRTKIQSAVTALLKARSLRAENAFVSLDWFDREFPRDGWDPIDMPLQQSTYRDYRIRVRRLIERMTAGPADDTGSCPQTDGWADAAEELKALPQFEDYHAAKRLIPVNSTLTNLARHANLQPADLDQPALMELYARANKNEHQSLRSATRLLSQLQTSSAIVAARFPHPIVPIEAEGAYRYNVPLNLQPEVEHFVEHASRKRYIRAKKIHEYVAPMTRTGFRTTMHAVVDVLVATGHLDSGTIAEALRSPAALEDVVGAIAARVESGAICARYATTLIHRLPVILERNGLEAALLRELIAEIDELKQHADKAGMPERVKRFCRKLIETRSYRLRFLLAHAPPRQAAQAILDGAAGRTLTTCERNKVIRFGVVALFCAIEIGGAPVRVENVLEMPYGGTDAWIRETDEGFRVVIPPAYTKNGEEIRFKMKLAPDKHGFANTIVWYLEHIRPLILQKHGSDGETETKGEKARDGKKEVAASPRLIPMYSNPERHCPYDTFHGWFVKTMRDLVGVPCLPHNYRHGQASLLYHRYPERIGWIATRLGDTQATVLENYAWVHKAKEMAAGQDMIVDLIEN